MNPKEYQSDYYLRNRDRIIERTKQYAKTHRKSRAEYFRNRRQENPETSEQRWKRGLWEKFKITPEEYVEILALQNGVCAICKRVEVVTMNGTLKRLPVDHNHATGGIRGILCTRCNTVLGLVEDNLDILKEAHSYLIRTTFYREGSRGQEPLEYIPLAEAATYLGQVEAESNYTELGELECPDGFCELPGAQESNKELEHITV